MVHGEATDLRTHARRRRTVRCVDDYLDSVREIERRVQKLEAARPVNWTCPTSRSASRDFDEQLKLMFDMIALAYQTNMTRIATFMMAAEVSNQTYATSACRTRSIRCRITQNNAAKMEKLVNVQTLPHARCSRSSSKKLAEMPDGERLDARQLDLSVRQQHEQQQLHN